MDKISARDRHRFNISASRGRKTGADFTIDPTNEQKLAHDSFIVKKAFDF